MKKPPSGQRSRRRAAAGPSAVRACQEKIFFPAPDGTRLCGILHRPAAASRSGVLLCHGMMSSKDGDKHRLLAEMLVRRGHWVLRFDFAGRGESGGDFLALSITRQAGEAGAALRILKARGLERVGVEGSSLGGAAAIRLASRGGVDALVTWAAVGRADRLAERMAGREGMEQWRRDGVRRVDGQDVGFSLIEDARRQDLLAAAARVRCHWLIVHGARDEVVPCSDAEDLYRAAGGPAGGRVSLEILPEADHQFTAPGDRRRLLDLSVDFLQGQLDRAARPVCSGARPGKEVA
jgi:pimeloyl-ACP methyl ester carboxylesterase